jgi:predicted nucleic acid-binding protein
MTMHDRGLLDTSVVIDLPGLPLSSVVGEVALSAITVAELAVGPHAAKHPEARASRQRHLQWVEHTFDVLPFDTEAARHYGQICALVLAAGRSPRGRNLDLQIAATAAANDLPLITRKPKDFIGLDSILTVVAI